MNVAVGRLASATRPHRSHRTLRVSRFSFLLSAIALVIAVVLTYIALYYIWPIGTQQVAQFLARTSLVTTSMPDSYLNIRSQLAVPVLPALSLMGALTVAGVCAAIVVLGAILPGSKAPIRYWILANALVLMITTLWAFFTGNVAYDAQAFMQLVSRTSTMMIIVAPVFALAVAALLPFTFWERLSMIVAMVALDYVIALVRLTAFPLLLARFGTIAEPNLYLFFGPLLDVVYFICVYSFGVVSLSRRLAKNEEAWEWL